MEHQQIMYETNQEKLDVQLIANLVHKYNR